MVCKVSRGNRYPDLDSDSDEMEEYEEYLEEDAHEVGYASEPTVGISDQVSFVGKNLCKKYKNIFIKTSYFKYMIFKFFFIIICIQIN
jgi:hypothetical protein